MWQSNAFNVKNTPRNETSCPFCQHFVCKITETFILKLNEQLVEVTNWLGKKNCARSCIFGRADKATFFFSNSALTRLTDFNLVNQSLAWSWLVSHQGVSNCLGTQRHALTRDFTISVMQPFLIIQILIYSFTELQKPERWNLKECGFTFNGRFCHGRCLGSA